MLEKCWNWQAFPLGQSCPSNSSGHISLFGSILLLYVNDLSPPATLSTYLGWNRKA